MSWLSPSNRNELYTMFYAWCKEQGYEDYFLTVDNSMNVHYYIILNNGRFTGNLNLKYEEFTSVEDVLEIIIKQFKKYKDHTFL